MNDQVRTDPADPFPLNEQLSEIQSQPITEENAIALTPSQLAEMRLLARKMADAYQNMVEFYEQQYSLTHIDAVKKGTDFNEAYRRHLLEQPPEHTTWHDLNDLRELAPELAVAKWEDVKSSAREALLTGDYMLNAADPAPIERAKFLAVREALNEQWQPQNQGEQLLVDMLAQLFSQWLFWQQRLDVRSTYQMLYEQGELKQFGKWKPPEPTMYDMQLQAAEMVDRFNRLFLRTLRGLRDLRRWSVPLTINNPGQVNIGAQQVNAAQVNLKEADEDANAD